MATRAESPGSESVDRLADALNGLELSSQAKSTNGPQEEPTSGTHARRAAESRRSGNDKENDESAAITPSRLTCFKQLREELTCAVCLDICIRPCTTPCGHNYCRSCLRRNLEINRPKCPKCRADLPASFTLNINTGLWCTIQHLFPAEASGKPLTPPPPPSAQQQQPAGGGQFLSRGAAGQGPAPHGTHIAAPFRPPRFVAAGVPPGPFSSRANAAAAVPAELSTMGTANFYGRSTSGPRPQRASSGASNSAAAAIGAAWGQPSGPQSVFSLAELGVRPAREGAAARRDRRRSRSAERWEGSERSTLLSSTNEEPAPGVAARRVAGVARTNAQYNALPASSSRLMELLSEAPRGAAVAASHGSFLQAQRPPAAQPSGSNRTAADNAAAGFSSVPRGGPQGISSGHSFNPFLRLPRPVAARSAAAAGTVAAPTTAAAAARDLDPQGSTAAGLRATGPLRVDARVQQGPAVAAGPSGSAQFTASQRALLNARAHSQGPPTEARVASSSRPTGLRSASSRTGDDDASPDPDGAPAPRTASVTSQGSGSCTSGGSGRSRVGDDASITTLGSLGSSWSMRVLDDASEIELVDPEGGRLHRGGSSTAATADGLVAPWGSSSGAGRSALGGRDLRADVVDLGSTRGSSLELLDEPTPPRQHRVASDAIAVTAVTAAGPLSPTWSHLDDQVARAMEPLHISPPSLPRLRLPSRQSAPAAAVPTQPRGVDTDGPTTPCADSTHPHRRPGTGEASWIGSSPRHMDPDLASNYDGEDPTGADTFFSSPFFDRKLLCETLEDGAMDSDGAGSEAGFSPRRAGAAAAAGSGGSEMDAVYGLQGGGGPLAARLARSADVGGREAAGRDDMAAALRAPAEDARLPSGPGARGASRHVPGLGPARREASSSAGQQLRMTQPQEALALQTGAAAAAGRGLHQAGDRGWPIELLSDSDEEEPGAGLGAAGSSAVQGAAAEPAARRSTQRVVPGLRRPLRT